MTWGRALAGAALMGTTDARMADTKLLCLGPEPVFNITFTQDDAHLNPLSERVVDVLPALHQADVLQDLRTHASLTDQDRVPSSSRSTKLHGEGYAYELAQGRGARGVDRSGLLSAAPIIKSAESRL